MLIRAKTPKSGGEKPSALISQQIIFTARAIRGSGKVGRKQWGGRRSLEERRGRLKEHFNQGAAPLSCLCAHVPTRMAWFLCDPLSVRHMATRLGPSRVSRAQLLSSDAALAAAVTWLLFLQKQGGVVCGCESHHYSKRIVCVVLCTLCVLLMGGTMRFMLCSIEPAYSWKVN